jgi:hypothetical protein
MQRVLVGPGSQPPVFANEQVAFEAREELIRAIKKHRDRGLMETVKWYDKRIFFFFFFFFLQKVV